MQYTSFIKRNVDFKRMYFNARFKIGCFVVIYLKKIKFDGALLGITVSKKVGNAVKRNRVRRIIKAAYFELERLENLRGFSVVVVAKKSCLQAKSLDILKEMKKQIYFLKSTKFCSRNKYSRV